MGIFSWLFGSTRANRERPRASAARKLSPGMPMQGVGAELAAEPERGETEESLERAATRDKREQQERG